MLEPPRTYWSIDEQDLLRRLGTSASGLTAGEAEARLSTYGSNVLRPKKRATSLTLFLRQFRSPLIIILLFAAVISAFLSDPTDAGIIISIVVLSAVLGFWQERGATNAVAKLLALVRTKASVMRDGAIASIGTEDIVPGDVIALSAGDIIPGDSRILESRDLFVGEATLTGETYPVEKITGVLAPETPVEKRSNTLFMGTHVVSGTARAVVASTGRSTEFGQVSERLRLRPPETEFEHGIKHFGYMLMEITLILVLSIFAINVVLQRPVLDSFLFSLALAVGLTPQLLPAIISINLAHGAKRMAEVKVIVKRLSSIENFGSMDILCSDKTGTLTQAIVRMRSAVDIHGGEGEMVRLFAGLNSTFQSGYANPIDEAIRKEVPIDPQEFEKLDEVPYDFIRKRLSILVRTKDGRHLMITKGAFGRIADICSQEEDAKGMLSPYPSVKDEAEREHVKLSEQGFRVLGVAYKDLGAENKISKGSERDMTLLGFLVLFDPPKPDLGRTIQDLKDLGVTLKVISGDNRFVATAVMRQVGFADPRLLTGPELHHMSTEALAERVDKIDVFAETEPNQKEKIILALKKRGHVVGYMGDGINDASALHAADVGISVDSAVDVAKEAADIVLQEKDLGVLLDGVREGRKTFANTMKYVFMATSANFGNMFSMAGASLFLSFLPLLPKQILLMNLLTDLPETTIATDNVDVEQVERPRRWDIHFIRRFMLIFGLISSIFDYLTFAVLILVLNASPTEFRTGWFIESVLSAVIIVLVIRTRRPFFRSRPSRYMLMTAIAIIAVTLSLPYLLPTEIFGFQGLPPIFLALTGVIIVLYIMTAEAAKQLFYHRSRR